MVREVALYGAAWKQHYEDKALSPFLRGAPWLTIQTPIYQIFGSIMYLTYKIRHCSAMLLQNITFMG
jgi:hypothetical protein